MSIQKKFVYSLIILPFVVSGILFANPETPTKANPKPLSATESQEAKKIGRRVRMGSGIKNGKHLLQE